MLRDRTLTQTPTDRKQEGPFSEDTAAFREEASALASRLSEKNAASVVRSAGGSGEAATVHREARGGGDAARSGGGEGGGGPSSLIGDVVSSSGGSLDAGVRGEMESKMGTNFSNVRVHTGPQAMKPAESIDATAFTVGTHIGFNSGAYDTSSPEGKHTIAHELAHVQQQAGQTRRMAQRVKEGSGLEVSHPKDPHEREADRVATQAVLGVDRIRAGSRHGSIRVDRIGDGLKKRLMDRLDGETVREVLSNAVTSDVAMSVLKVALAGGAAASATALSGGAVPVAAAAGGLTAAATAGGEAADEVKSDSGVSEEQLANLRDRIEQNEQQLEEVSNRLEGGQQNQPNTSSGFAQGRGQGGDQDQGQPPRYIE